MDTITAAKMAIEAWHKGESAGSYASFKKLLSNRFNLFSHPVAGLFKGEEAKSCLNKLMAEQEKLINELVFSNIEFFRNGHGALVMFDCRGTMMGGRMYYNGSAVIYFAFDDDGNILAFKIYIGTIDTKWFEGGAIYRNENRSSTPR